MFSKRCISRVCFVCCLDPVGGEGMVLVYGFEVWLVKVCGSLSVFSMLALFADFHGHSNFLLLKYTHSLFPVKRRMYILISGIVSIGWSSSDCFDWYRQHREHHTWKKRVWVRALKNREVDLALSKIFSYQRHSQTFKYWQSHPHILTNEPKRAWHIRT